MTNWYDEFKKGLTLDPIIYGLAGVDWQERINFDRLRKERYAKVQAMLKHYELGAALLVQNDNIRYATATQGIPYPQSRYALVFAEYGPVVFEMGEIIVQNKKNAPWIGDDNWRSASMWESGCGGQQAIEYESKMFARDIKEVLEDLGLGGEPLGVDTLDDHGMKALKKAGIEITTENTMKGMLEARRCKTIDEVNCIRMATNLTTAAHYKTVEVAKVGVTEQAVSAAATAAMIELGAEMPNMRAGITSGPRSYELCHMPNTDRILEAGDTFLLQCCGTSFAGYRTCTYRNFVVGRQLSEKQRDWYKRLYERVYRAISEMKPGATTWDVSKHFGDAEDYGFDDYRAMRAGEVAHGVGLSTHEYPWVFKPWAKKEPLVLEEGMVIAVELHEGERWVGGFRLEEMVVVTTDGHEVITTWPSEEPIVCNPLL